ncbi:MAG: hypothetical protein V2B18_13075 [Pseudomonadota bacterium]
MKRLRTLPSALAATCFLMLLFVNSGICWQPPPPPIPMGMDGMGAPCPPPGCAPPPPTCMPAPCEPECKFSWELGARAWYSMNELKYVYLDARPTIDFVRDLNMSPGFVLAEIYGSLRVPPKFALNYTVTMPRLEGMWGTLPSALPFPGFTIPAGSATSWEVTPFGFRQDIEYYFSTSQSYRLGALIQAEIWAVQAKVKYRDPNGTLRDQYRVVAAGQPGVGGVLEVSASDRAFAKVKAAYTFLPQTSYGYFVEVEAKYFPSLSGGAACGPPQPPSSCGGPGVQPYIGVGYRFKGFATYQDPTNNDQILGSMQGPWGELGVIF